jgi:hypothetical protein
MSSGEGDCFSTSHIGANADSFKTKYASNYNALLDRLRTEPYVKVVYMSLGGNDMFKYWNKNMGAAAEQKLFVYIKGFIQDFINDIHAIRPDVNILVANYDNAYLYKNAPFATYRNIYEHMGEPSPAEVYGGFTRLAAALATLKADHVVFQQHIGVMHYYYGAPEAGVAPFKTLNPTLISTEANPLQFGGVAGYRNNKYAQGHIFDWYIDPHHLRPMGFMRLFEHSIDTYIGKWLNGAGYKVPAADQDRDEEKYAQEPSDELQHKVNQMVEDGFDKMYEMPGGFTY